MGGFVMKIFKSIGMCIAIAGGITAFILCMLAGMTQFVNFLWVGFMSMIIYFAAGGNCDWKLAGRMLATFICGLLWGALSNLIYIHVFGVNTLLASVLDYFLIVFLLLFVHIVLLAKTPFNFVPTAFLGLATTIGFYGRPFPLEGMGLAGNMSPVMITVYLIFYVIFGLVFSLMINYITVFFAKFVIKPDMGGEQTQEQ